MAKPRVAILGCTGMLGSMILDWLAKSEKFDLIATHRSSDGLAVAQNYPAVAFRSLDAESSSVTEIATAVRDADWIVNAIGIIKPYIHVDNAQEVERALRVNALFPQLLAQAAQKTGAKIIQIATDCVFSGEKGDYVESDLHDALDVYGKTKSLGEAHYDNCYHIRCSIIGPELSGHLSLLDWFLGQDKGTTLNGFINHCWNGVTTLSFARLVEGIIAQEIDYAHLQHIVPGNRITKAALLEAFAKEFNRSDIIVNEVQAPKVIDRTLSTEHQDLNTKIWKAAGYISPPTIEAMVTELGEYKFTGAAS